MHLPCLKREGLWSVMLNADKRTTETKGNLTLLPLIHYLGTLTYVVSACDDYRKPCWIFLWNWIKWIWVCSDFAAHSFTSVSAFGECLQGAQRNSWQANGVLQGGCCCLQVMATGRDTENTFHLLCACGAALGLGALVLQDLLFSKSIFPPKRPICLVGLK